MRVVDIDVVLSVVDVGCLFKGIGSFHQIVIPEGEGVFRHFAIQQVLIAGVGGHEDLSVQHVDGAQLPCHRVAQWLLRALVHHHHRKDVADGFQQQLIVGAPVVLALLEIVDIPAVQPAKAFQKV